MVMILAVFALAHSGLAGLRPLGEIISILSEKCLTAKFGLVLLFSFHA